MTLLQVVGSGVDCHTCRFAILGGQHTTRSLRCTTYFYGRTLVYCFSCRVLFTTHMVGPEGLHQVGRETIFVRHNSSLTGSFLRLLQRYGTMFATF